MEQNVSAQPDTDDAKEGTAAHEAAALVLRDNVGSIDELIDRQMSNGVIITETMAEHIQVYIEHLNSHSSPVGIEQSVNHAIGEYADLQGTCDAWTFDETARTLYVYDFKYGYRLVEVDNNWQLFCYALGLGALAIQVDEIVLTIVQPRPYHSDGPIRSERVNIDTLRERFTIAEQAVDDIRLNPVTVTGSHCLYCSAFHACPASQAAGMNTVDVAGQAVLQDMSDDCLASELVTLNRAKTMLDNRMSIISDMAKNRIKGGGTVPGWSLERTMSNRKWKSKIDSAMFELLAGQSCFKTQMFTPAAAKRAGVSEELINAFTERVSTGIKLKPTDINKQAEELFK